MCFVVKLCEKKKNHNKDSRGGEGQEGEALSPFFFFFFDVVV